MKLSHISLFLVMLVPVVCAGDTSADSSAERVILSVKAHVVAPGLRKAQSTKTMSTLDRDDIRTVDLNPYELRVAVTDKRANEYSIELTIVDELEIGRDSATLLLAQGTTQD